MFGGFLRDADWLVNCKTVIGPRDWCGPEVLAAVRVDVSEAGGLIPVLSLCSTAEEGEPQSTEST